MTTPATTDIGFEPYPLDVHLSKEDADFIGTIRTSDSTDFPAGAAVTLKFNTDTPTLWAATVTGPAAAWNVDKTEVAALVPGTRLRAHILYSDDSGADLVWFSGSVEWHA